MRRSPSATVAPAGLDSLLTGDNAAFIDAAFQRWVSDPSAVDPAWAALFASWGPADPGAGRPPQGKPASVFAGGVARVAAPAAPAPDLSMAAAQRQARVAQLINAYRVRGHVAARIDPLGQVGGQDHEELRIETYGLTEADLDLPVSGRPAFGVPEVTTLRTLVARLRKAYCGGFGVEFMNIGELEKKRWLQERFETLQDKPVLDRAQQLHVLRLLADAENFERLLHNRYPGTKRFSVEGAETLVPLLDMLLEEVAKGGVDSAILGMAHRGRLNVLANILDKPIRFITDEFEDQTGDSFHGSGDVKYHLGFDSDYETLSGRKVHLSLSYNPSHLEAVNPVVEGRARALQDLRGGAAGGQILPILIHGDAAFAGQGVVAETLNLSELRGYRTGGTVHVVINNQIGFTTSPEDARSTPYCTDVARMLAVPIFHVNGEDVEAVAAVVRIAAEWRQTFAQDVVIDMYCFRKHGHNEGDEPSFTQPLLYEIIRTHPSPRVAYARWMVGQGAVSEADVERVVADSLSRMEELLRTPKAELPSTRTGKAVPARPTASVHDPVDTTFDQARLVELLVAAHTIPEGFAAHRKIQRLFEQRLAMIRGEKPIDWAVAEQAAYAALVDEGFAVRISGQDCGRGTFSHRHAVLTDITTGKDLIPLAHLREGQASFEVYDSLLSEAAVLGFEYGYTLEKPDALVVWEAQFGDFANGAQVIIDNFLMSSEQKWNLTSGLVMLLPHGYEGQGPEHSSARLERYLQLCAEDNIFVANCTTPANFFHLLRRQLLLPFRKPCVVMSPKSLLRHPECVSTLEDLTRGTFQRVIPDAQVDISAARRVVFCSGKVYYELADARRRQGVTDVALVRVEQLYPFPAEEVEAIVNAAPASVEVVWCQEEPKNMGAWPMMDEWMTDLLGNRPRYVGRARAAAPATGSPRKHKADQDALIRAALA
jgi:2-oxoglutarate dehydrogenase E1 component